jgi:hypothetical protein
LRCVGWGENCREGGEGGLPRMVDIPREGACLSTATEDMTCSSGGLRRVNGDYNAVQCRVHRIREAVAEGEDAGACDSVR